MSLIDDLIAEIAAYCNRTGTSRTAFGEAAMNDARFLHRLEGGADIKASTIDHLRSYMKDGTGTKARESMSSLRQSARRAARKVDRKKRRAR